MAVKLLITDGYSPLGRALWSAFECTGYAVLTPRPDELDWGSPRDIKAYLKANDIAVVVNNIGWREVPDVADQLQLVMAAKTLAAACSALDVVPLHLSSYRVFGGENKSSYDELDKPAPLGAAGRAFLESERYFEQQDSDYLCLRIGWLLDVQAESVLSYLLQGFMTGAWPGGLDPHLRGAPIASEAIGRVVVAMVHQVLCGAENWGTFHCASSDPCSGLEFMGILRDTLIHEAELNPEDIASDKWKDVAPLGDSSEPDSSVLAVRRLRDNFGVQQISWRQGLGRLVKIWLEREAERRLHDEQDGDKRSAESVG